MAAFTVDPATLQQLSRTGCATIPGVNGGSP
jgi:hypothetical protein